MKNQIINKDIMLFLTKTDNYFELSSFEMSNIFSEEELIAKELCQGENDNILEIITFIKHRILPRSEKWSVNYCNSRGLTSGSYYSPLADSIDYYLGERQNIYANFKKESPDKITFPLTQKIVELKNKLYSKILECSHVSSLEEAYKRVYKIPNLVAFSLQKGVFRSQKCVVSREFNFEIRTNFGYGRSTCLDVIIAYKGIVISSFSDWIS